MHGIKKINYSFKYWLIANDQIIINDVHPEAAKEELEKVFDSWLNQYAFSWNYIFMFAKSLELGFWSINSILILHDMNPLGKDVTVLFGSITLYSVISRLLKMGVCISISWWIQEQSILSKETKTLLLQKFLYHTSDSHTVVTGTKRENDEPTIISHGDTMLRIIQIA